MTIVRYSKAPVIIGWSISLLIGIWIIYRTLKGGGETTEKVGVTDFRELYVFMALLSCIWLLMLLKMAVNLARFHWAAVRHDGETLQLIYASVRRIRIEEIRNIEIRKSRLFFFAFSYLAFILKDGTLCSISATFLDRSPEQVLSRSLAIVDAKKRSTLRQN